MRPNILLIHCHDLGNHLHCCGHKSAHTPNLDALAREGVLFEQYFACAPTCSPSRGTMLTGLLPHRNGLMALASGGHWEVEPDIPTLPHLLQQAGYETACYGTWHISAEFGDRGIEQGDQDANCLRATANAIRFLERRSGSRPFYLMVGYSKPHQPFTDEWDNLLDPKEVDVPGYLDDTPEIRRELARFYGDVSLMDASAGQVLAALQALGLESDTLVIFTSDHGVGLPLAKGTLYDPGIKIPLIVRWKGRIEGGRRCSDLACNADLLPTVLDAVGQSHRAPADLDGHSLWPFISGNHPVAHPHVFSEQTWHDFYEPIRAIRTDRYKLIRNLQPGPGLQIAADILPTPAVACMREKLRSWRRPEVELYDLHLDPWERNNLAGSPEHAEIESALASQLEKWMRETGDPLIEGVVPAPSGYWEHFCAKPNGPGGLPPEAGREEWLTVKWPLGATRHRCPG